MWFADRFVGEVEDSRVAWVNQRRGGGFHLVLDDGGRLEADAVVVACGLRPLAHVPRVLADLAPQGTGPRAPVSHSSDHSCLSGYAGQQIAVVGGGQSAMESAALLHESGALVEVLVRGTRVRWGQKPTLHRPLGQRIARPASPLGPGWALSALCRAPAAVGRLPAPARLWVMRRALGPSGAWWLRDRVEGVIPVRTDAPIRHACLQDGKVRLAVGDAGAELTVDHVLAATGYRIDVDALPFLASELRPDGATGRPGPVHRLRTFGMSSDRNRAHPLARVTGVTCCYPPRLGLLPRFLRSPEDLRLHHDSACRRAWVRSSRSRSRWR